MTSRRNDGEIDPTTDRALLGMARIDVPVEPALREQARRDRVVPRLSAFTEDLFAHAPRHPRRARIVVVAMAAAALAAALGVLVWHSWRADVVATRDASGGAIVRAGSGAIRVRHAGSPTDAVGPFPVSLGAQDRVETGEGHAEVNLASGAVVALDPATELELGAVEHSVGTFERIQLAAGRISVKVPKLPAGSSLVIGTPQSTVTVHGTAFVVQVQRASGTTESFTTVSVTEGRVSVKREGREVFLGPGTQWSSAASSASGPAANPQPSAASSDGGGAAGALGKSEPRVARTGSANGPKPGSLAGRSSTLPQENSLLRSAMTARRDGDPTRALELIAHLLSTYPESPLGPEARAERERALADLEAKPTP